MDRNFENKPNEFENTQNGFNPAEPEGASGYTVTPNGGFYNEKSDETKEPPVQAVPVGSYGTAPETPDSTPHMDGAHKDRSSDGAQPADSTASNFGGASNFSTASNFGGAAAQEAASGATGYSESSGTAASSESSAGQDKVNNPADGAYKSEQDGRVDGFYHMRGTPEHSNQDENANMGGTTAGKDPFGEFFPTGQYSYMPPKPQKPKKEKKRFGAGMVVTCAVLAALIGAGGGIGAFYAVNSMNGGSETTSSITSQSSGTVTNINVDKTAANVVEAVASKASPSVVGIRTTAAVTNFFGGSSDSTDEGSGVIYTADGYIITNYHVISPAVESQSSKIEVYLPTDTSTAVSATVVGYNIAYDLAVIKIDKTGLTPIEFGDSSQLKVGEYAIAIGNPGGLEFMNSVSFGIISGLNRSVSTGSGTKMSLIQTDAAINPGNSGGALLDVEGKLIGVNSVKLVDTSFEGMGFAIPSNDVKDICDKIISKQNEPTPYIGIEISQRYTAETLERLGYPAGAVVNGVTTDSPADESGIQRGDIITEFNGVTISSYQELENAIANCSPGSTVTVKLYRAGRFYSTSVRVDANNAQ